MATTAPIVVPGDRLGSVEEFTSGEGTYVRGGHVYASLLGLKSLDTSEFTSSPPVLRVQRIGGAASELVIPDVGSVITGKVISINARVANVQIVCVDGVACAEPFSGIIRKENVVATDIDRINMEHCMRPGDVIIAEVVSLGDSRSYFLTTAKETLGVVFARSADGNVMEPISLTQMECPVTHVKEDRKVAVLGSAQ